MKKLILLVLILVVIVIVIISKDSKSGRTQLPDGTYISNQIKKSKWEYVKDRLFSGKEEGEFVYRINQLDKNAPILIDLKNATGHDSIAVNGIISELRTIIPNKTIDYFKNYTGITYIDFSLSNPYDSYKMIKGFYHFQLNYSTIHLSFGSENDATVFDDIIETKLIDGSRIERTNSPRSKVYPNVPSKVWFGLKETLPIEKRKKYIKYELLRTLCFLYPNSSHSRSLNISKGVFFTPNYIPHLAELNDYDKFLLQKLYEDDFLEQFKAYLYAHYPWRYAFNFLNKSLSKTIAWTVIICIGLLAFILLFSFFQNRKFKYAYLEYFLPIYFIMLYYMNLVYIYLYITANADVRKDDFNTLILIGFLVATVLALLTSFILWIIDKFWANKISNLSFQLIIKVISTFFIFNIPGIILLILNGSAKNGFLEFYLPTFIFTIVLALGRGFLIYLKNVSESLVKQKDVELSRLKEMNAQSELKLLQSHINPHFLYNALNSIAGLAHSNADKTEKMALSLSDLFRYSINKKGEKMSTVREEVTMVENYLEIEKIRFGNRLSFKLHIDETIIDKKIPMYMLQPLVENAIKHGVSKIGGEAKIGLEIIKEKEGLLIIVSDNGPDFPNGLVSGHGLQTVYDLLRLSYGDKASLSWENEPTKQIVISIKK